MTKTLLLVAVAAILCAFVHADVYMHNPRGSNNRNCERNENRNNDNRLFDSQNNARGGYACPRAVSGPTEDDITKRMYYYVGSILPIEWTAQHSCGINTDCQIIIQYMCNDTAPGMRDGTPTNINDAATDTVTDADPDNPRFGSHEPKINYDKCRTRFRNRGLYIADQGEINPALAAPDARATRTRQNANGDRYGWECTEERDYYPYWHPSPWKDVAIFTTNTSKCEYYQKESQNVANKGECYSALNGNYLQYNNMQECLSHNGNWVMNGSHGINPPECLSADLIASRDNHLGNSIGSAFPARYNWTIPDNVNGACVVRIRYNISTLDFHPFETDSTKNGINSPLRQDPFSTFGGYKSHLSLAVNSDQYSRTFEDRSYVFQIRKRPDNIPSDATIYNLNIRGKRGNIVQTFPAVEYDFIPNYLEVKASEYVHIQWTGSDYNPARNPNDGEGGPLDPADNASRRSDRNNMVQLDILEGNVPRIGAGITMFLKDDGTIDQDLVTKLAFINQPINGTTQKDGFCLDWEALLAKNNNNKDAAEADKQNCAKLNGAPHPYFDAGLVQFKANGRFAYGSTRNNNFSNRSQKGMIVVRGAWYNGAPAAAPTVFAVAFAALMTLLLALL